MKQEQIKLKECPVCNSKDLTDNMYLLNTYKCESCKRVFRYVKGQWIEHKC